MSTYKETINAVMTRLGYEEGVVFIGYNLCAAGGRAGGSLATVPDEKIFEMPLAENLMVGAAIGLSLQGYTPVLFFERADFILCALDSIVNHLAVLSELSEGVHRPTCIIRVVVGNSKTPLFTGITHSRDHSDALREMLCPSPSRAGFHVEKLTHKALIAQQYEAALNRAKKRRESTILFEYKDAYSQ